MGDGRQQIEQAIEGYERNGDADPVREAVADYLAGEREGVSGRLRVR